MWVFLWMREMDAGQQAEPVTVILKAISSVPVTLRVHFRKSRIALVHLLATAHPARSPFWKAMESALLNNPQQPGKRSWLWMRACWKRTMRTIGRKAAWSEEDRKLRPQPVSNAASLVAISTQACLGNCPHKASPINSCLPLRQQRRPWRMAAAGSGLVCLRPGTDVITLSNLLP